MLQNATVVTELPRTSRDASTTYRATDVVSLVDGQRKKRPEKAIAVDGACINIYDIRTSNLLTGYAVPPGCQFSCNPISIRIKSTTSKTIRRLTIYAPRGQKAYLQIIDETLGATRSQLSKVATKSLELPLSSAPVTALEALPSDTDDPVVLAIHQDGSLTFISPDPLRLRGQTLKLATFNSQGNSNQAVVFATTITLEQARKSFLRGREDILASLEANSSRGILLLATHQEQGVEIRLMSINLDNGRQGSLAVPETETFATLKLPCPPQLHSLQGSYFYHENSGQLYQYLDQTIAAYSFDRCISKLTFSITLDEQVSSCVRLGTSEIAISQGSNVVVLNTHFRSVVSTSDAHVTPANLQSRKETIIGIQGTALIALSYGSNGASRNGQQKRAHESTLIDAIGRGIGVSEPGRHGSYKGGLFATPIEPECAPELWNRQCVRLESHYEDRNVEDFDIVFAEVCHVKKRDLKVGKKKKIIQEPIPREQADYLLSRLFSVEHLSQDDQKDPEPRLTINFLPQQAFERLMKGNQVNAHNIESALKKAMQLPITTNLADDDLVRAFLLQDTSLGLLNGLLLHAASLTPIGISYALRTALQRRQMAENEMPKLLTNGEYVNDDAMQVDEVSSQRQETQKPTLNTVSSNAHSIIRVCLNRLDGLHPRMIQSHLSKAFATSDLLLLLDHLRFELVQSGWTAPYADAGLKSSYKAQTSITTLARMLNCTLTTLGTAGFISNPAQPNPDRSGDHDDFDDFETADTIALMKAEISAALEGIEEIAYLQGVLGEVLLYADAAVSAKQQHSLLPMDDYSTQGTTQMVNERVVALQGSGEIVTMPTNDTFRDGAEYLLPLGLKAPSTIGEGTRTRVGAGGEIIERTGRERGYSKSRKIGEYSFERILV
ncbi:hypothetical protein MMC25_007692 [Agyrium rufum]|nr:hypothetical protein [Agyrium rufum]